jgi:hypothetical protein
MEEHRITAAHRTRAELVLAMDNPTKPDDPPVPSELAPEDFYMDGPYLVFTAAYHLKRGYCCNSNCRHCPYR